MKKSNVLAGSILILVAAIMMGSAMGIIPDIPWFKLLCAGGLLVWGVKALLDREFFGAFMSMGLIAWLFDRELMIENMTPFPLLAATALAGIGLNMIFGKKEKFVQVVYENDVNAENKNGEEEPFEGVRTEEWTDGRQITLVNSFNSTSKYVNAAAFSSAKLENDFGSANIYFNNANVANGEATIHLSNNFGKMNVYIPSKWRASISQSSAFGHVGIYGEPNRDMDAPHVIIKASANFGDINIFFE